MNSHPSKMLAIKEAEIDLLMIPLIKWLNNFPSVITTHCCQGDEGEKQEGKPHAMPYVQFICSDQLVLAQIIRKVGSCGTISVHLDDLNVGSSICYNIMLNDQGMLNYINEMLPNAT